MKYIDRRHAGIVLAKLLKEYSRRTDAIILALPRGGVPVAALSMVDEIACLVDVIVCPLRPVNFYAVGLWYDNFSQTTDEEVIELLEKSKQHLEKEGD